MVKASESGGVQVMSIQGRLARERERLVGMTDEERAFRKQFLKAQILSPNEPRPVPQLYKEFNNPIRRFYKYPLNRFQEMIEPKVGPNSAYFIRYMTGKAILGVFGLYYVAYYLKYNSANWVRKGGWNIYGTKKAIFPGEEGYPRKIEHLKPSDYASKGFENCTLNL